MKTIVAESNDSPIKLKVLREGQTVDITTHAVEKDGEWRIGIGFDPSLSSQSSKRRRRRCFWRLQSMQTFARLA